MFDMGWDKLLLVGLLVGLVAGPERLLAWSRTAVQMLGRLRGAYREGKAQVVGELDQFAPDWRSYDPGRWTRAASSVRHSRATTRCR